MNHFKSFFILAINYLEAFFFAIDCGKLRESFAQSSILHLVIYFQLKTICQDKNQVF